MPIYTAAVIGLGQIGLMYDLDPKREKPSSHTLAFQQNPSIKMVAAADSNSKQAEILYSMFPKVKFYKNIHELFQNHDIDIVSICTPPESHLDVINYIIDHSNAKVIFCEKPLVTSIDEAVLLKKHFDNIDCLLVPNLSRRWNSGMQRIHHQISCNKFGELQKVNVRYTRGIHNTGAHVFDLLHWWIGKISEVQVIEKVRTSADYENDPSFSFIFKIGSEISGYAEAFNDEQYYLFEIDLYFTHGKIEIRCSGDEAFYYHVGEHHLFSGFKSLYLQREDKNLLLEANLGNAVSHLVEVIAGEKNPICTIDDGIYPLYVAEALLRSYDNNCSKERLAIS